MLKFILILIAGFIVAGVYALGIEDFIRLITIFFEKGVDFSTNWFENQKDELLIEDP